MRYEPLLAVVRNLARAGRLLLHAVRRHLPGGQRSSVSRSALRRFRSARIATATPDLRSRPGDCLGTARRSDRARAIAMMARHYRCASTQHPLRCWAQCRCPYRSRTRNSTRDIGREPASLRHGYWTTAPRVHSNLTPECRFAGFHPATPVLLLAPPLEFCVSTAPAPAHKMRARPARLFLRRAVVRYRRSAADPRALIRHAS